MEQRRMILEMTTGDRARDGFEIQVCTRYHWSLIGGQWIPLMGQYADIEGSVWAYGVRAVNRLGQVTRWEMAESAVDAFVLVAKFNEFSGKLEFKDEE